MIIYNKEKCESIFRTETAGVVGENLVNEVEFLVRGFTGENVSASIHLRFADGSVNSVVPQSVKAVDNDTLILWKIEKNDIFCHGRIEVQLELRDGERLFQTEIVRLFAGESLPVEDREYSNPNSETLALRDETKRLWEITAEQNEKIEENIRVIAQSEITLKENISNKAVNKENVTAESYPSVEYLNNYYYDAEEIDGQIDELDETVTMKINLKADKATTLSGYGISDAYDKTYLDKVFRNKLDKMPFDTAPVLNSPNYVTSGTVYSCVNTLSQTVAQNKAEVNIELAKKYDSSNVESGTGELSPATDAYNGCGGNFVYAKNGDAVTVAINLTALLTDKNYQIMSGLPFTAKTESKLSSLAVYSTTNKLRNIRIDGSWIYVSSPSDKFADGEKINLTLTYIIKR